MKLAVFFVLMFCFMTVTAVKVSFDPPKVEKIYIDQKLNVSVSFHEFHENLQQIYGSNITSLADPKSVLNAKFISNSMFCEENVNITCNGTLQIKGRFLGFGKVFILRKTVESVGWTKLLPPLDVTVLREDTVLNKVFTAFVATVVAINYINMGCALELDVVKGVLRKPIGPAVGFVCQFVVMPLVAYGVGHLLFKDPVLRLGLFTFGSSPGGGASNMWTVLLNGNLNLSITMTFVSTVAALGAIPLWLFTLGRTIVQDTKIVIPFTNILASLASLTIPVCIGLLIQRYFPKIAARAKRFLAPICIIMIICIIVLAAVANSYMFFMLTWRMVIAASLSVWTGFAAGALVSLAFRFPCSDIIAIAVETGIQNSGIAFLLLSYSLKPPVSDMASVVPVAGSIITPIPLFIIYCGQKLRDCCFKRDTFEIESVASKTVEYNATTNGVDNPTAVSDVNY